MSTSEERHRWDGLERKHERQDWGGMDMYGGKMMGSLYRVKDTLLSYEYYIVYHHLYYLGKLH